MQFMRATRRTTGAIVLINCQHITAMEEQITENLRYTAIILHNGREIDVSETMDTLFHPNGLHLVHLHDYAATGAAEGHR